MRFKGSIKEFRGYLKAMQDIFGKNVKVKDIVKKGGVLNV